MKIITLSYYDDIARFLWSVSRNLLQHKPKGHSLDLAMYPSGFLFGLSRCGCRSIWLPFLVYRYSRKIRRHLKSDILPKKFRGIILDSHTRYNRITGNATDETTMRLMVVAYIVVLSKILRRVKPDCVLMTGDSRMAAEILGVMCKRNNIPKFHFEQGPFRTTIIDSHGVNANCGFRNHVDFSDNWGRERITQYLDRKKCRTFCRTPIFRGIDFILESSLSNYFPPDIRTGISLRGLLVNSKNQGKNAPFAPRTPAGEGKRKRILLILQVPVDVNMAYHSPLFSDHASVVRSVTLSLPQGSNLFVREHPLYKNKYEADLYRIISQSDNVHLDVSPLRESLLSSDLVIVNNSTVGLEAIALHRKVIVLGNAYYDDKRICRKVASHEALAQTISDALSEQAPTDQIDRFLTGLFSKVLISGHFRDQDLIAARHTAQIIAKTVYGKD